MPFKKPYSEEVKAKIRGYTNKTKQVRKQFLAEYKLERGCADCGYAQWPEALDFDHVADDKVNCVSYMALTVNSSWQSVLDEIAKCEVVCANCHRHRTEERRKK